MAYAHDAAQECMRPDYDLSPNKAKHSQEGAIKFSSLNRLNMLKYCRAGIIFDAQLASAEEACVKERERCREEAEEHTKSRAQASKLQVCSSQASVCCRRQTEGCLRCTVGPGWVPWYQDSLVWQASHKPSACLQRGESCALPLGSPVHSMQLGHTL